MKVLAHSLRPVACFCPIATFCSLANQLCLYLINLPPHPERRQLAFKFASEFTPLVMAVVIVTAGTDAVIAAKKATSVTQLVRQKESRPKAAPCFLPGSSVVIGVSDRVLHVAGDIMRGALRLVDFAFRLQLLIAGYLAG